MVTVWQPTDSYPMSFAIAGGNLLLQPELEQQSLGHSIRGKQPSGNLWCKVVEHGTARCEIWDGDRYAFGL
ncbi:hypothetical protein TIFTF001_028215 [Ficus carica]|uniref:Uncharacterized protein n=1 Tax=Ficus carica TaxID=3494 RepID=A0AA88J0X3_FICCA|nr:hypothetical protein TIFTF001_028215 [Ficus carica]